MIYSSREMAGASSKVSEPRHYGRPPITEAVIELQCALPSGTSLTDLLGFHEQIRSDYPNKIEQHHVEAQIPMESEPLARRRVVGYRLSSKDEKQIVQARLNTFAFSRLAPYDRWEPVRTEAHRLWEGYRETLSPVRITRAGVRYINRIDIPSH